MRLLDRYLLREMLVPFLIGQFAVVLMLTGTVLYNNADVFLNYRIPALGVTKIAFFFMPYLMHLTMPVAMAIATSLTVSRLARDSEVTVMRAAGISLKRIFLPLVGLGLVLSIGDFFFGEHVVPWANTRYEQTMSDLSRSAKFLVPQERQVVQSADRKYTIYIGRMELRGPGARLYDVQVTVAPSTGRIPTMMYAETADYDNGRWTLYDAKVHIYRNGGEEETFMRVKRVPIDFRLAEKTFNLIYLQLPLYSSASTVSFKEMSARIGQQRKAGYVNERDLLDYYSKLSVPFSCLVFAIVCPPMALRFARAGNFMGVLLSIILVFVYWNTLLFTKIIGANYPHILPPLVAAWGQNVVFSCIGIYVLWRGE